MKNVFLIAALIGLVTNLFSQDMIVKKDGEEIKAKIIEIGVDNVKFKKFENLEGPDYVLPKHVILFIRYENGNKEIFEVKTPSNSFEGGERKGIYLGFHFVPGVGEVLNNNLNMGFAYNFGLDVSIYFNKLLGVKTGLEFQSISTKEKIISSGNSITTITTEKNSSFGIPLKLLITTGKKIGFYGELGIAIHIPLLSEFQTEVNNSTINNSITNEPIFLSQESVAGLNVMMSENVNLNFGVYSHYSMTDVYRNRDSKALIIGLQFGVLFRIPN